MNATIRQEARRLLAALTRDEKTDLVHGVDSMWTCGVPRLGVRKLRMADASMGLRDDATPATAFPAFIALAATWSCERAAAYGQAVAEEFRAAGVDVLLGPGVNLYRTACCGRNFEYLGEDPCLASQLVAAYIRSAQAEGVSTTVKHLAANNSDWHRCCSNSVVDERTLREVYLPAFEAAVKAGGTRALMTSYNLLNGEYTAENRWLLHRVLREDWGFDGLVMSDWNGVRDLGRAFRAGLDLDMPGVTQWNAYPKPLRALLDSGEVTPEALDRSVFQILAWTLEIEKMQEGRVRPPRGKCADHAAVALQTAREGIVLLRNRDHLLPLNARPGMRLCVVGPAANPTPTSGGGAAEVKAVDPVSILGAVCALAPEATVLRTDRPEELARADAVIVCVGYDAEREREGLDRPWELHWHRDVNVIRHCQKHNPRTIVVIVAGGGVEMASWIDGTAAVLHAWYPGENGCRAIAEILFGQVNPSGRLPITIERSWADGAATANYLPPGGSHYNVSDYDSPTRAVFDVKYEEGIFVGHRHCDRTGRTPLFPFGFGLSYTTFEYSGLRVKPNGAGGADVTFCVRNTGARAGAEVAQVYVGDVQASAPRPARELKGFARMELEPGQERETTVALNRRAFAFYDVARQDWVVEPGEFRIWVASSSQEMRLEGALVL
jgi:beta-glucosidase